MVKFLTTANVASKIDDILRQADRRIGLVSPYIQLSDRVESRLLAADQQGKQIVIVYGKKELHADTESFLSTLDNLHLFYNNDLHAKCYFNEHELVITSMNLYEYSEKNNHEMGVHVTSDEDLYMDAADEVELIAQNGERRTLSSSSRNILDGLLNPSKTSGNGQAVREPSVSELTKTGHCIRCSTEIDHNPDRPFCYGCFKKWRKWENPEYEEDYCHTCGEKHATSKERPQCKSCWRATRYA